MSEINYTNQIRYTGNGPLDTKLNPVQVYEDLMAIPRSQRYEGMTILVISDVVNGKGGSNEYWLVGGTMNSSWTLKSTKTEIVISGDDV